MSVITRMKCVAVAVIACVGWRTAGAELDGVPVCTAAGAQGGIASCFDGQGGTYVVWEDRRSGMDLDLYVHRLDATGTPHSTWPVNGMALCRLSGDQRDARIVTDGTGGAFIAWQDRRNSAIDLYVVRVTSEASVAVGWPDNGVLACSAPGVQSELALVADGAGGVFLAWTDFRVALDDNVYALHLDGLGRVQAGWPLDGRRICNANGAQHAPSMIAGDDAHHILVAWEDGRSGTLAAYAHRVADPGHDAGAWPVNGLRLGIASGDQTAPAITTDGAGGAFVVWEDRRGSNVDLYVQRVSAAGEFVRPWRPEGHALCTAAGNQLAPRVASDDAGGVIAVWFDARAGAQFDVYAHRFDGFGSPVAGWPFDGQSLCTAPGDQLYPAAIADGAGGVIAAWGDGRATGFDPYAARIAGDGRRGSCWPADGLRLSDAGGDQDGVALTTDGTGGVIFTWEDRRASADADIFALRVDLSAVDANAWPPGSVVVSGASGDQLPSSSLRQHPATTDGAGGAFFAWVDARDADHNLYVQRIASNGAVAAGWNPDGNAACTVSGLQDSPLLVPDDTGGVYALWSDARAGELQLDVYAQHLLAGGGIASGWPAQGLAVCAAADLQHSVTALSDGAGGFFAFWQDRRDGAMAKVYGIRMRSDATPSPGWTADGRALCPTPGAQTAPRSLRLPNGNVIVVWQDRRSGTQFELRGLGLTPLGGLASGWDPEGNAIVAAPADEIEPRIAADGSGGTFVLWKRDLATTSSLHLQRILATGQRAPGWPADGIVIEAQTSFDHDLVADGTVAALAVWGTVRGGRARVFVQRVAASGSILWSAAGVPVDAGGGNQMSPSLAPDGIGGALVAWMDVESNVTIRTQHLHDDGGAAPGWNSTGESLNRVVQEHPYAPALVREDDGCSIVSWFDVRPGTGSDLFAARLHPDRGFAVDAVTPGRATLAAWPNPFVHATRVRFALPIAGTYDVEVFDARGRRVRRLLRGVHASGWCEIAWDGRREDGSPAPLGVYWLRASGAGFVAACKLVRGR